MRLATIFAVLVALAVPTLAAADIVVGAEVSGVEADSGASEGLSGTGFGLRLGWTFDLPLLRLEPELGASRFGLDATVCPGGGDCRSVALTRVFAGARASLDTGLAPGVFVRGSLASAAPDGGESRSGTMVEAGLSLDVRLLPLVEFGVHGMLGRPSFEDDLIDRTFYGAGAHVAVVL